MAERFSKPHSTKFQQMLLKLQNLPASFRQIVLLITLLFLSASCQQKTESGSSGELSLTTTQSPRQTILKVAKAAQTCWFKTKDPAFVNFRLASEVNSHAGRPRFLLVPKSNLAGLPLLVVQAESLSGKTKVQSFGPLLSTDSGKRINADILRWASGNRNCSSSA